MNAPLEMASAVFEASKPIFPAAQRLIRSDEECVRLALATLYGSERRDAWGVMSGIFECLPAWDVEDEDNSSAETTLASLGAFVAPTTARARATPEELFVFFKPLPAAALSRALDILDVHLESGEIMSRWGVPAPLRWFLQSHDDASAQRSWAVRMARMAAGLGERVDTEDEWEGLLDDMLKLSRHGAAGLRGAFGLLERDEVIRIFFSGLLSTGGKDIRLAFTIRRIDHHVDFDIARVLLHKTRTKLSLAPSAVEDICVSCSREFYDNASSGNYKMGDMKLAYDWYVAQVSPHRQHTAHKRAVYPFRRRRRRSSARRSSSKLHLALLLSTSLLVAVCPSLPSRSASHKINFRWWLGFSAALPMHTNTQTCFSNWPTNLASEEMQVLTQPFSAWRRTRLFRQKTLFSLMRRALVWLHKSWLFLLALMMSRSFVLAKWPGLPAINLDGSQSLRTSRRRRCFWDEHWSYARQSRCPMS
jgi:hypothetical protein